MLAEWYANECDFDKYIQRNETLVTHLTGVYIHAPQPYH